MTRSELTSRSGPDSVLDTVTRLLRTANVHTVLAFLNARTRHRYTGVYQFCPPMVRCFSLFDRENPTIQQTGEKKMCDTYCAFVARDSAPFSTSNSLRDHRLLEHPARRVVMGYHAVPLRDTVGACFGSICHWDVRPRVLSADDAALLHDVAPLIAREVLAHRRRSRGQIGNEGRSTVTMWRAERAQVGVDDEANDLRAGRGGEQPGRR